MKYLYLRALKVDRRILGHPHDSRKFLDCIKIAIGVIGIISMWLIFFLHQNGTAEARPTPHENPSLAVPFMPLKSEIFSF